MGWVVLGCGRLSEVRLSWFKLGWVRLVWCKSVYVKLHRSMLV